MSANEPDYVVCLECETPCYVFEWNTHSEKVVDVTCTVCGNDQPELFNTAEEFAGEEA